MTYRPVLRRAPLAALIGLVLVAAGAAIAEPPRGGYAPDPPSVATRKQWVFDVLYTRGKAYALKARAATLERPAATARAMGRFAIELYVGKELLDRVRFNVPLTGDAPEKDKRRPFRRPTFDEGVTTRLRVQMADNPRAAWARLVDRLTGAEQRFWWPPGEGGRLTPLSKPPGKPPGKPLPPATGRGTDAGVGTGTDAGRGTDAGAGTDAGTRDGGAG